MCDTTPPEVLISGFDFTLAQGDFWTFDWDTYDSVWAQGSGTDVVRDAGRMWVVLGTPITIQGITAYTVRVHGHHRARGVYDFSARDMVPRWKYVAMAGHQMLGSNDGTTLAPIFDARSGRWPGGGFFASLSSNALTIAQAGTIASENTHISGSALVVGTSSNQSQCEYFPGIGTICGEDSSSSRTDEYYRPGVGPVGFYHDFAYENCGGGFCSGGTDEDSIGLVASSLTGQSNPLVAETEPNDTPAGADMLAPGHPIIGEVAASTVSGQGNTPLVVSQNYTALVEDWFAFSLAETRQVTITLYFDADTSADLDLYLADAFGTTLLDYSFEENPATKVMRESITLTLGAGTYRVGVDGYTTPSGAVPYTLVLD